MSTDIPSHNLAEIIAAVVKLLDNPKLLTEDLRKIIIGPDFPTKGEIVLNESDLDDIYLYGTGNIKIRATYEANGKEIIIKSIPYQANTTKIIEQIQEQILLKKSLFLESVMDASDQENPVRIILKVKGRTHHTDDVMSHFFFTTDLEKSLRVNLNMIGLDGKPQVKNLQKILLEWIKYRLVTITNKLSWELDKIQKRIHILDAYIIVYNNLDKIIQIIRNEDDSKKVLIKTFKFTDAQYEAIINMKIRSLAKLQEKNIVEELKSLNQNEKKLMAILKSKAKLNKYLKDELLEILDTFSRERQTKISNIAPSKAIEIKAIVNTDPVTSILSKNGWLKFSKGHDIDINHAGFKTGDEYLLHENAYSDKSLVFLDQLGFVYNLDSTNISISRGQGEPLSKYFQIQDGISVVGMHLLNNKLSILTMTNYGYGFICLYEDLIVKNKKGKTLLRTKDSLAIKSISVDLDMDLYYLIITDAGYMLISKIKNVPILSKGRGVKLINLPKLSKESIVFTGVLRKGQSLSFSYDSNRKRVMDFDILKGFIMERNRRGKKIDKKFLLEKVETTYNIE